MSKYLYEHRKHNKELQKMLFMPLNRLLHESKLSWDDIVKELNLKGFKCTKSSLIATQQGHNFCAVDLNYFSKMYLALGLPVISLDYIVSSRDIYNQLKPQKRVKNLVPKEK